MAKLFLKNAYEFENPSRRVFKEGGGELFGSAGGQAAKINTWVGKGESSPEARALAENVSKQAEEIREGARKELLELYVNIFTDTIPQKEVYNVAPLTVDATYAKNGLLQVLEKNSPELKVVFQGTPDLRLLSYATVYQNFKAQGLDVNFLPIGAKVELVNGDVTVTYIEKGVTKTATSEIFPWSTYELAHQKYLQVLAGERAIAAARIEEEGGVKEDEELREVIEQVSTHEEVLKLQDRIRSLDTSSRELERINAEYIQILRTSGELNQEAVEKAVLLRKTIFNESPTLNQTVTTMQALSAQLRAHPDLSEDDKVILDSVDATLDLSGRRYKSMIGAIEVYLDERREMLANDRLIMNEIFTRTLPRPSDVSITTEFPNGTMNPSMKITVKNTVSGEAYILFVDVPNTPEEMPMFYIDPRVKVAVKDGEGNVLVAPPNVGNNIYELGAHYIMEAHDSKGFTPKNAVVVEKEKVLRPKAAMEAEMDALFVDFNGSPESWQKVDAQYKKMRTELPQGRIRALDHYRGSEAAARAGRIDEAIALLDLAAKNAGDKTYEKTDSIGNQEALKSKYGALSLNEQTNHYFTYTPAPGAEGQLYTAAALEYAKTEFQKNGRFEGRVPLGTYDVGGTKIYTVTAEGATMLDKNTPTAATAPVEPAPTETSAATPAPDQETLKQNAQVAADSLELSMLLTPRNISDSIKTYERRVGAETEWVLSQFQDGDFSYLIMTDRHLAPPNGDGSAEWTVDFKTADGEVFRVSAQADPVIMAKIKAYREAQAARGLDYSEADLIKYIGYRTITNEFARNMRETRDNVGLNKKYMAYLAVNRPEVADVAVPPTEARVLSLDDEEPMDLGIRSIPDTIPGLPEGNYKEFDPHLFSIENPYTGLVSLEWPDGTFFKGAMKDSVPNGMGVLGLGGADETLGPVQFIDGKATVELPDGKKKEITWDTELFRFEIRDL